MSHNRFATTALLSISAAAAMMVAPTAHADDALTPIRTAVEGIRGHSNCPALNYRADLEGAAQGYARGGKISANGYPGTVKGFKSTGDPQAEAINNLLGDMSSYQFEPLNCTYLDFGVGFLRVGETDTVTMALGIPDPPDSGPGTCLQGFVWREASPTDHVCVSPGVRDQTARQNGLAAQNREPNGGAYGADTCKQGLVWRDAFAGDHVCVLPPDRDAAANDNAATKYRVAAR